MRYTSRSTFLRRVYWRRMWISEGEANDLPQGMATCVIRRCCRKWINDPQTPVQHDFLTMFWSTSTRQKSISGSVAALAMPDFDA